MSCCLLYDIVSLWIILRRAMMSGLQIISMILTSCQTHSRLSEMVLGGGGSGVHSVTKGLHGWLGSGLYLTSY